MLALTWALVAGLGMAAFVILTTTVFWSAENRADLRDAAWLGSIWFSAGAVGAGIGFLSGLGFALMLAGLERGKHRRLLSVQRFTLWGACAGVIVVAGVGLLMSWPVSASLGITSAIAAGAIGALCARSANVGLRMLTGNRNSDSFPPE